MSRDELLALAERVEAAKHDDKVLFEEVWETLCQRGLEFRRYACTIKDKDGSTATGRFMRLLDAGAFLDAAMSLVPEGCLFMARTLWDDGKTAGNAVVFHYAPTETQGLRYDGEDHAVAATPALALTAAALSALAEKQP